MLIRALRAENFMKFSSLRLEDLPCGGVVGIEGPNESGKSTIGAALLFAFFGRSRLCKDAPLDHLIRWGSDHLRVEVAFDMPGSEGRATEYLIYREIDRFGTNYVKVLSMPDRREVAAGNMEVSNFVAQFLKFDFLEFQQAFYYDQYDRRLVDPSLRSFIDRMSGVSQLRAVEQELKREMESLEREFGHYQKDIARNLLQIEKFQRNIDRLPELEAASRNAVTTHEEHEEKLAAHKRELECRRRLVAERDQCERLLRDLATLRGEQLSVAINDLFERYGSLTRGEDGESQAVVECQRELSGLREDLKRIRELLDDFQDLRQSFRGFCQLIENEFDEIADQGQVSGARRTSDEKQALEQRMRRMLRRSSWLVLVAVLAAVAAMFLGVAPFVPERPVAGFTSMQLAAVASGLALLSLLGFAAQRWRVRHLRVGALAAAEKRTAEGIGKLEAARTEIERLKILDSRGNSCGITEYLAAAEPLASGPIAQKLQTFRKSYFGGDDESEGKADVIVDGLLSLSEKEKRSRKRFKTALQEEQKRIKELEGALKKSASEKDRVENEVREYEAQVAKKDVLEEKNRELDAAATGIESELEDRRTACQLLNDTSTKICSKTGPTLGKFLRELLPHLTAGRYRDVKIGEGLDLQVFASERSDFLSSAELSGGTNEALMLALRLAFAQGFIAARSRQPQFMFLDEPFKMMDVDRVLAAVRALPELSPDLQQFFVIQPNFSKAQRLGFDCLIRTSLESSTLEREFGTGKVPPLSSLGRE